MTTIAIAHTVPLNASSKSTPLTASHLWIALVLRTRNPERFSSIITRSSITSESTRASDGATMLSRQTTYVAGTGPPAAQMAGGTLAETCAVQAEARVDVTTDYGGGGVSYIVSSMDAGDGDGDGAAEQPLLTALYHFRHPELSATKDRPAIEFLRTRYQGMVQSSLGEFVRQVREMGARGELEGEKDGEVVERKEGVSADDALNVAAAAAEEASGAPAWPPQPLGMS